MALTHDIVRYAGKHHVRRGRTIDSAEEKQILQDYFRALGHEEKTIYESLHAISPECIFSAKGVWWLTLIHPTKVCVMEDRIVYIRRFVWFKQFLRQERSVMIRHIREVERDEFLFSAKLCFRTHRSVELFQAQKLNKKQARQAQRIIQALIHDELHAHHVKSADDVT